MGQLPPGILRLPRLPQPNLRLFFYDLFSRLILGGFARFAWTQFALHLFQLFFEINSAEVSILEKTPFNTVWQRQFRGHRSQSGPR